VSKKKPSSGKVPQKAADVRISEHPRARRSIGLAKSYAGLAAFLVAGYVAWKAGLEFVDVALRAVGWGLAAYVLVWTLAVHVWRHLAIAEVRAVEKMDFIQPIGQEPHLDSLQRVQRLKDEQREQQQQRKKRPQGGQDAGEKAKEPAPEGPVEGDDGHLHIDIRA
jgi:hypothetical protein